MVDTENGAPLPGPDEIAATTARTLALPEIAALRSSLVPEWPIYAMLAGPPEPTALAGRIDAMVIENGKPTIVLDWKSDVAPTELDMREHAGQLSDHLRAAGAPRGAVVYMTTGVIRWVAR